MAQQSFSPNVDLSGANDDDEEQGNPSSPGILDLTEAKEESYPVLSPGTYPATVKSCEYKIAQRSHNPMLEFQLVVEPQEEGARRTTHFTYAVLTPEQYGRVKKLFVQCFPDVGLKWDPTTIGESLVGRPVRIRVSTELYEGERRNRTKQVLPAGGDESFMAL